MKREAEYCGIDVSLKTHTACLMDEDQKVIKRYSINNDREGFEKLENDIDENTKICLEPTGVYSVNIFIYFEQKGYDIKFCGTKSAADFRKSMFNKKKHDNLDCVALAKYRIVNEDKTFDGIKFLDRLSSENNNLSDMGYITLSDLLNQYARKTKLTSSIKNVLKNIIDLRFPEAIQVFSHDRGCRTILKALAHSKEDVLRGKVELIKSQEIKNKLRNSIGQYDLKISDFKYYVKELEKLEAEIKILRKSVKEQLGAKGYSSLFNFCGLDTINIAILITEIRDIRKFFRYSKNGKLNKKRSLKTFKEFMGISVTSNQSGNREGAHKLAKSGNAKLRSILFMMALTYISMHPKNESVSEKDLDPYRLKMLYEKFVKKGKKKLVAVTKVMNKIATDLFFILKEVSENREKNLINSNNQV